MLSSPLSGLFFFPCYVLGLVFAFGISSAQEETPSPFEAESLKLRTALHYDSSLGSPLDALVRLYQEEERGEELIGLYQAHIAGYPDDAGAKAVLARIYQTLERPEKDEFLQAAAQRHPEFSHLQYLLSQNLKKKNEDRSLDALSRAIDLETGNRRRSQWLGELLDRSTSEKGRQLAETQLKKLLSAEGQTGPTMLSLGQVMHRHRFFALSLDALKKALALKLTPEEEIEAAILAARAEAELGNPGPAGQRLDAVLKRLAPDHYRRSEVMTLRVSVIASDEERATLIEKGRKSLEAAPSDERRILDYAELLISGGRREDAIQILLEGSDRLPESQEIERTILRELEQGSDLAPVISFLEKRLETFPDRTDLRYRLVKANYLGDDDDSASQDFAMVLAGLEEGETREDRILDLARFLKTSDKRRPAIATYQDYLALNPQRLDVARELAEIFLEDGLEDPVKKLVNSLSVTEAEVENLLDLSQFLTDELFFASAEKILTTYIAPLPSVPFEPGLALARVQGELGRGEVYESLQALREQVDTPSRYKKWLDISLLVSDQFNALPTFFETELSNFSTDDSKWSPDQIENYLYLCESGERRQLTAKVASNILRKLGNKTLDAGLKIRLRQLLVRALERQPDSIGEVEQQLNLLAKEDPESASEYNLKRALLYHQAQRPDLASGVLNDLDLSRVRSTDLLRDSYRMLMEFGDLELASAALAAVTSLEPTDLFSWERRLSLLAAKGNEDELRSSIRSLQQGIAQRGKAAEWRADSRKSLQRHLLDSYWRSISPIISRDNDVGLALPLLDSVASESKGEDLLWASWARALIYGKLGRETEREAAIAAIESRASESPETLLKFPDGLSLPILEAVEILKHDSSAPATQGDRPILPLLDQPVISWAFEAAPGATILDLDSVKKSVLALDDRGVVYRVDSATGKLVWRKSFGLSQLPLLDAIAPQNGEERASMVRQVRRMIAFPDSFVLEFGSELRAFAVSDGGPQWKFALPSPKDSTAATNGAYPGLQLARSGGRLIVHEPFTGQLLAIDRETGKLLWQTASASGKPNPNVVSMNSGLSVAGDLILVYGKESGLFRAENGKPVWSFQGDEALRFPVVLREQREDLSEEELVTLKETRPERVWTPVSRQSRQNHLSYLDGPSTENEILSFIDYPGALLAPAAAWNRFRLATGEGAAGRLSEKHLWLMDPGGIRLISLDLPLASDYFKVTGTFVGAISSHAWILDRDQLIHIDGGEGIVRETTVSDLGPDTAATLVGSWIYVRGQSGVAVFNASTGKRIAKSEWDEPMKSYLGDSTQQVSGEQYTWQGIVRRKASGHPRYCYRILDTAANGRYLATFGGNRIVAITD